MRLKCPNCDVEYQVPDDVIPVEGRDVQCSNCSHTWFFTKLASRHGDLEDPRVPTSTPSEAPSQSVAPEAPDTQPPIDETAPQQAVPEYPPRAAPPAADEQAAPPTQTAPGPMDQNRAERELSDESDVSEKTEAEAAQTPKSYLSDEAAEVLRQEAALEAARRQNARSPDDTVAEQSFELDAELSAQLEKAEKHVASAGEPSAASTLADVDSLASLIVNSQPSNEEPARQIIADDRSDEVSPRAGRGEGSGGARGGRRAFWIGFGGAVVASCAAVAIYAQADEIGTVISPLGPPLEAYVHSVDNLRLWIARLL